MKLSITKITLILLLVIVAAAYSSDVIASTGMSPREGYVKTTTGAPMPNVRVVEYSDWCPPFNASSPACAIPSNCHAERSVMTDATGRYFFEPWTPQPSQSDQCNLNAWWMFTCWNPSVFFRVDTSNFSAEENSQFNLIPTANAQTFSCPPVQHPTDNVTANIVTDLTCKPPAACNVTCEKDGECAGAKDGCTSCLGGVCRPPQACNSSCNSKADCAYAPNGCNDCVPNDAGTGKVCRPTAACNSACVRDDQCAGAVKDGCTVCSGGTCKAPACNIACERDDQCAGAKDGCTSCVSGTCRVPPACGTACTTKAECSSAKDGCSECAEGTCTDYNDNMCKCDGIVADIAYPTNQPFKFEAFGKVEGSDVKKAEIADITFRLTKDNQVIAKSDPIAPQIVENTASKLRFKATWQTAPPQADKNSTYRVFADVRCKPKKITASAGEVASAPTAQLEFDGIAQEKSLPAPKGLVWISQAITNLFGEGAVSPFVKEAMAQLSTPSPAAQAESNLQLRTLNFIKMMDTDNCRFVMWKFDETLF